MRTRPDLRPVSPPDLPRDPRRYEPHDEPAIRHDGHGTLWFVTALLALGLLLVLTVLTAPGG